MDGITKLVKKFKETKTIFIRFSNNNIDIFSQISLFNTISFSDLQLTKVCCIPPSMPDVAPNRQTDGVRHPSKYSGRRHTDWWVGWIECKHIKISSNRSGTYLRVKEIKILAYTGGSSVHIVLT